MKKIFVMGNVTADAVVRISEGKSVINFTIAENERYTDNQGIKREKVTYFNCAMWRDSAVIAQHIKRGIKVYVDGKPSAENYTNKQGEVVAIIKITVRDFEFAGTTKNEQQAKPSPASSNKSTEVDDNPIPHTPDDDLPF